MFCSPQSLTFLPKVRLAGGGALAINGTNSHGTGRNLKRGGKENAT